MLVRPCSVLRASAGFAAAMALTACATGLTPLAGGDGNGSGDDTTTDTPTGGAGGAHTTGTTTSTSSSHGGAGGSASSGGAGGATTTTSTSTTTTSTSTTTTGQGGGPPGGCALGHVVISEVRTRGAAGASDEFVELFNASASPVTLDADWQIEGRSTSSGTYTKRWAGGGGTIPAFGHFLVVGSKYAQSPGKDDGLATGITDASSLKLMHSGQIVDAVCFGFDAKTMAAFAAGYDCEGTPVSNQPHDDGAGSPSDSDASIERKPGGAAGNCTDTGDNASDFAARAPATPLNSQSPPTP